MSRIVTGAGFGDEGKGSTVDWLVKRYIQEYNEPPTVVRFQGGHQCGHHVVHDDVEHVFSNFGSGTLRGAPTYWGKGCTIDPVGFVEEYEILRDKNIVPSIFAAPECMIVTPYDKQTNRLVEKLYKHGSTGAGFGATVARNEGTHKLHLVEMRSPDILEWKMSKLCLTHEQRLLNEEAEFYEAVGKMLDIISIIPEDLFFSYGKEYIFEGNQGILLDKDYGFFPHVTRAITTSRAVLPYAKYFKTAPFIYFVTRAYGTRHGNGPFPEEAYNTQLKLKNIENENNNFNEWQGEFRRAPLNLSMLAYAIMLDTYTRGFHAIPQIIMTCTDQIATSYFPAILKGEYRKFNNIPEAVDEMFKTEGLGKQPVMCTASQKWSSKANPSENE